MELTGVGIWSSQLRYGDADESTEAATELEELGFTALWIPDVGGPVFDAVGRLLAATARTVIATGVLRNLCLRLAWGRRGFLCDPDRRARRPLSAGHRCEPRATDRRQRAGTLPQTTGRDGVVSGMVGCRATTGAHRAEGACRTGPEVTQALFCKPREGRPPLPLHARAHRLRPFDFGRRPVAPAGTDRHPLRRRRRSTPHRNRLAAGVYITAELRQQPAAQRLLGRRPGTGERSALRRDHRVGRRRGHHAAGPEHRAAGADHVCVQVIMTNPRAFPREQWRRIAAACKMTGRSDASSGLMR